MRAKKSGHLPADNSARPGAAPGRIRRLSSILHRPIERRSFLHAMAWCAVSLTAACGGGEGGSSGNNASSSPGSTSGSGGAVTPTTTTTPTTTPPTTTTGTSPTATTGQSYISVTTGFYGINGHLNSGYAYGTVPMASQMQLIQTLGMTNTRQDLWDIAGAENLAAFANTLSAGGIQVTAVITPSLPAAGTGETAAYNSAWQLGYTIASTLKGLVHVYECGNELEDTFVTGAGDQAGDYQTAAYLLYRGVTRGLIEGVRAADAGAAVGVTGSWLHYGALQMLWDGTDPSGDSGAPVLNWDITSWHWYSDMGDITSAGDSQTNVLAQLTQRFQRPIWISEYGYRPNGQTGTTLWNNQATYLQSVMAQYLQLKSKYNLQCIMLYELFDMPSDSGYGLIASDGSTQKPAYSAVQSFIAKNPA